MNTPRVHLYFADPASDSWLPYRGAPSIASSSQVYAAAARTALVTGADLTNSIYRGGHFIINVTALTAGASITPTLQGKAGNSGVYYDLLVGAAITATGITVLKIYPGIIGVPNVAANDFLPNIYRFNMAVANANSVTYSIGFNPMS